MIVLGIDPGSLKTGYALVEEKERTLRYLYSGIIDLSREKDFFTKVSLVTNQLREILQLHLPDEVALESLIYVKSPTSLIKLAQIRGAMLGVLTEKFPQKVFEYPPNVIKSVTAGYGHAQKESIQKMLRPLVGGHFFLSDDESDAVAVALCHITQRKNLGMMGRSLKGPKLSGMAQALKHCHEPIKREKERE